MLTLIWWHCNTLWPSVENHRPRDELWGEGNESWRKTLQLSSLKFKPNLPANKTSSPSTLKTHHTWVLLGKGELLPQASSSGHPRCSVCDRKGTEDGPHWDWGDHQFKTTWLYLLRHLWPGPSNPKLSPEGVARLITPIGRVSGVRNVEPVEMEPQSVADRPFLGTLSEVPPT